MDKKTHFDKLTENVIKTLAVGEFPTDTEEYEKFLNDIDYDRVLATIEYPYIDIELEIWTADGFEPDCATETDNSIAPSYFVCTKGVRNGEETWVSYGDAGDCYVDFSLPYWEELLEHEMEERLAEYADKYHLSYASPNFNL